MMGRKPQTIRHYRKQCNIDLLGEGGLIFPKYICLQKEYEITQGHFNDQQSTYKLNTISIILHSNLFIIRRKK